jgi:hypothetical protein
VRENYKKYQNTIKNKPFQTVKWLATNWRIEVRFQAEAGFVLFGTAFRPALERYRGLLPWGIAVRVQLTITSNYFHVLRMRGVLSSLLSYVFMAWILHSTIMK